MARAGLADRAWQWLARPRGEASPRRLGLALPTAAVVVLMDVATPADGAATILYAGLLVLPAAQWCRRDVVLILLLCATGMVLSYALRQGAMLDEEALLRRAVSLLAILGVALLTLRNLRVAEALEEQASLLALTDNAVAVIGPDDRISFWNRGAEQLYGWPARQAIGRPAWELLGQPVPTTPTTGAAARPFLGRWEGEWLRPTRGGSPVRVAVRKAVRPLHPGLETIEASLDISGRRRAAEALSRSEARYRAIFQTLGTATWEEDHSAVLPWLRALQAREADLPGYFAAHPAAVLEGFGLARIVDVNAHALRLLRATDRAEVLGSPCRFFPAASLAALAGKLVLLAGGGGRFEAEVTLHPLHGPALTAFVSVTVPAATACAGGGILPAGASPVPPGGGVLVSLMDVTAQRRAEEELNRARADLARLTRAWALGEVTASIVHEVNQPLAAALTNAKAAQRWLERARPDPVEAAAALQRMVQEGHRARSLMGRVRASFGPVRPVPGPVDLHAVVAETLGFVRRDLAAARIATRVALPAALPLVWGDRICLQQVVLNLLTNAMQAMTAQGNIGDDSSPRSLDIVALPEPGGAVRVTLADNGPGVAPESMARLFQPFFTTRPEGMGLGLSICSAIVLAHGGRIWAEPNPTAPGLSVSFTVPPAGPLPPAGGETVQAAG